MQTLFLLCPCDLFILLPMGTEMQRKMCIIPVKEVDPGDDGDVALSIAIYYQASQSGPTD